MYTEGWFRRTLQLIREDDIDTTELAEFGDRNYIQNFTDENWEQLGRDISNNTHFKKLELYDEALDDHKISSLFRGMTRSSSITELSLCSNGLGAAAARSMVPFLQNANNLYSLDLDNNNIQSEGFNLLFRALRDSPIKRLDCGYCGIESIEIDTKKIPRQLKSLYLENNIINADGCRGLSRLLRGGDATLGHLSLQNNQIDDEGVEILVDVLKNNTSLTSLSLEGNHKISKQGQLMLLKLVSDVSSIEATLQSNHTLSTITVTSSATDTPISEAIHWVLDSTGCVNVNRRGRAKVIETQLRSASRAELAEIQGVNHSVYSEINPLHLPEVLALVGRHSGRGELFVALRSSIAGVISTVNRKECLKQQTVDYEAKIADYSDKIVLCRNKIEAVKAEIAAIEAAEVHVLDSVSESRSNKRRRF